MKRLSLTILLLGVLGAHAFGQATWFPGIAQTTTTVSATNTTVLVPLPGASITFCGYPSNGSLPCTNKAAVCPDITGAGCTTGAPNNPVTADSLGNFGAWLPSGSYDYTVCAVSGVCRGPYHAVVVSSNGAQGVFTVDGSAYTTIQSAITAAGTTGSVLIPPTYAGTDVYTNPNKIQITDLRGKPNRQRGFINALVDCGLKGDGVTDDYANAQTCLNSFPEFTFYFPPTKTDGSCSYMFSATLKPTGAGTTILGGSAGYANGNTTQGGTTLCWTAGVTGIELDLTGQNCSGCNIRDISLYGSASTNHLATPTLLNIPSGANLPLFNRTITSIQRATNVLTVNTSKVAGVEGLTQQVGSTVKISGVVSDTTMNGNCVIATLVAGSGTATNPTQFTCAQNGSNLGPFVEGKVSLPTTGASAADGILLCTNFATIIHVVIANFGRHGINADSSSADSNCPSPFSDDLILRDSTLIGNQADGYLCNGTDCNAHLLSGNSVYYNVMWGLEDQSSLGNTHIGNQLSNGGHSWASSTVPATKAISTIARTLTGGISQVSVVLSVADTNITLGSCVVIAGVTDTSFNTTSGQCFFINSFTDSTHYGYEQPGAPANASSSSGTSRMAKFAEAYLSSGVDDGAQKIATQSGVAQPTIVNQYVEGGQNCKWSPNVILVGGANTPGCAATTDWTGNFLSTQGCSGFGGTLCSSLGAIWNNREQSKELNLKAGISADQDFYFTWVNHSNARAWRLDVLPSGTLGADGYWHLTSDGTGQSRIIVFGANNNSGATDISAEGTGAVRFGRNFAGTNAGTGGVEYWSGGASPAKVSSVDSAGLGTFNGGVKAGSSGSTISDSRELVQNAHECGTTTACANTANLSERMITGTVPLSSATPSTATITGISPAFTSTATYFCTATPEGATAAIAAGGIAISKVSGSSFTLTGPATVTTVIDYICIGH